MRVFVLRSHSFHEFRDNFILPVIRHPVLRSGVQSAFPVGQASCLSIEDGQDAHPHRETPIPPKIASGL